MENAKAQWNSMEILHGMKQVDVVTRNVYQIHQYVDLKKKY